ncbi:MAG: winged helix-turn-helix domain-containing protein [Candidatus Woesearchaeota archaeon]
MELAPMFMEQRWNILQHLSRQSLSPLQLAGVTNTTIANISQQLRLLEAADLVKKTKIPNRDKGQPRTLFSLTDDYAYIVSLMDNFAQKKLVKLNAGQKSLLKILSIEDSDQRSKAEELYFKLREFNGKIEATALDLSAGSVMFAVCSDKEMKKRLDSMDGLKTVTEQRLRELFKSGSILPLDDPRQLFKIVTGEGKAIRT